LQYVELDLLYFFFEGMHQLYVFLDAPAVLENLPNNCTFFLSFVCDDGRELAPILAAGALFQLLDMVKLCCVDHPR
jgi:hypothetical protein